MLNWLLRYAPVAADVDVGHSSVLDVGSGSVGLSCVFPDARFAGQDLEFVASLAPGMFGVRTDPGRFPWADGAFDTVVCLDVLEHIPGPSRAEFVAECARVAARRVLLSCPTDSGADVDEFFVELYRSKGGEPPPWLHEHQELGLPSLAEVEAACTVPGFNVSGWPQVNGHLAALVVVGDLHPFFASDGAAEYAARGPDWVAGLQRFRFGEGIRRGFDLERIEARAPLVDPSRFDETIAEALECPVCGERFTAALACSGCGRSAARDSSGAVDLRADALTAPTKRLRDRLRRR